MKQTKMKQTIQKYNHICKLLYLFYVSDEVVLGDAVTNDEKSVGTPKLSRPRFAKYIIVIIII